MLMVFSETALQMADVLVNAFQPKVVVPFTGLWWETFGQGFQLPCQAAAFRFQIRQAPLVRREKMKTRSNTEADTAYEWIWEPYPRQIEIRVCEEKRADGLVRVHEVGKSIA